MLLGTGVGAPEVPGQVPPRCPAPLTPGWRQPSVPCIYMGRLLPYLGTSAGPTGSPAATPSSMLNPTCTLAAMTILVLIGIPMSVARTRRSPASSGYHNGQPFPAPATPFSPSPLSFSVPFRVEPRHQQVTANLGTMSQRNTSHPRGRPSPQLGHLLLSRAKSLRMS